MAGFVVRRKNIQHLNLAFAALLTQSDDSFVTKNGELGDDGTTISNKTD